MSHTPGPWVAEENKNGALTVGNPAHATIAELWRRGDSHLEHANARLIAAAPELLEALQEILAAEIIYIGAITETLEAAGMDSTDALAKQARAAVNKALGK